MHELALAHSIVRECAARAGAARVRRVTVEVGTLTHVLPENLELCFLLAAAGSVVEGARLDILRASVLSRCRTCAREVVMDDTLARCACGSIDLEPPQGGTHLLIRSMQVQTRLLEAS